MEEKAQQKSKKKEGRNEMMTKGYDLVTSLNGLTGDSAL